MGKVYKYKRTDKVSDSRPHKMKPPEGKRSTKKTEKMRALIDSIKKNQMNRGEPEGSFDFSLLESVEPPTKKSKKSKVTNKSATTATSTTSKSAAKIATAITATTSKAT